MGGRCWNLAHVILDRMGMGLPVPTIGRVLWGDVEVKSYGEAQP